MNKKIKLTLAALLIVVLTAGCAKKPPTCSDEGTFTLIRKIIIGQLGGRDEITDQELQDSMKVEYPRASAFDESIKKFSCVGKLVVGGKVELPITYESQLDDNDQHIVTVGGIAEVDLISIQQAVIESVKKGHVAKLESEPQAQTKTTPNDFPEVAPDTARDKTEVSSEKVNLNVAIEIGQEYELIKPSLLKNGWKPVRFENGWSEELPEIHYCQQGAGHCEIWLVNSAGEYLDLVTSNDGYSILEWSIEKSLPKD